MVRPRPTSRAVAPMGAAAEAVPAFEPVNARAPPEAAASAPAAGAGVGPAAAAT
jgi:hypothetical protein